MICSPIKCGPRHRTLCLLLLFTFPALTAVVSPLQAADVTKQKVVVLGFDGADDKLVRQLMEQGELPNLQKLKDMGGYTGLMPTNPPQTPVSWSTFATGLNPGRTGIFDFLRRQDGTYIPDFALRGETRRQVLFGENNRFILPAITEAVVFMLIFVLLTIATRQPVLRRLIIATAVSFPAAGAAFVVASQWLPNEIPAVVTVRKGKPIWKMLEEQGKTAKIIRLPVTFPAEPLNGEMIAGLAVPDIRGTIGRPTIFTNDPGFDPGENQFSVLVNRFEPGMGPFETEIMGPPNKLFYDAEAAQAAQRKGQNYPHPKDFALPIKLAIEGEQVVIQLAEQTLKLGAKQWSDTVVFTFSVNPLISLKGFGRFYLDTLAGDRFKLYLTAVNLHPESPLPLSYPADFSAKLWQEEPFKTQGWALDTWSIGGDLMDEDHFMEDVNLTVTRFETMMEQFLDQNDRDLFVQVFSFTDRVAHILWRYWDEGHPLYDPALGPKYQEVMRETYRRMDRIVGKAMAKIDFETTALIVCSDHGFASFRYQFHFNTWLYENGYLKLKENVLGTTMKLDDLINAKTPFNYVDWEQTKAYALGLGMIFVNLEGREPEGSVTQAEYDALCAELVEKLESYVDPETGMKPVRKVFLRDEMYKGYNPGETPDLRVATAPDWRVSWDTTLGGLPNKITDINPKNWSGDHCSLAPEDVKGIFFSSLAFENQEPSMADMCPSLLDLLDLKTEVDMDGATVY